MAYRVEAVEGRRGVRRFIDVPWRIFDGARHPQWSPPLRMVVRDLLDPSKDPFYRSAERRLFVATDGHRPLGRIAAIENRAHNRYHGDRVGFFGFFECVDDRDVAKDLFAAAEGWLRERGLEVSRGPMSPSMNHECGLLVEGNEGKTVVFTPWNPAYYDGLVTGAGYAKAKDLLAYDIDWTVGHSAEDRLARLTERLRARSGMTFRDAEEKHFSEEVRRVWPIYVDAWRNNWGFVPPDWPEFEHLANSLKPLMVPDFCYIAEMSGEPIGFMIIVSDFNELFRRIPSGRLGPAALWHLVLGPRKLKAGRVILFGLKQHAQRRGLFPVFANELVRRGKRNGFQRLEASWVLEDNHALTGSLDSLGARAYRRWRIYDKALTEGDARS